MQISLIAALTYPDRVIGLNNKLPWNMPGDLQHFKSLTLGKSILMGRKTFASIGKALPNRQNIIITRDLSFHAPDCIVFHTLETAFSTLKTETEVFVIGGEDIFNQTLPHAHYLYLTFIHAAIQGDTYFPAWDERTWREISRVNHNSDSKNPYDYSFVLLEKILVRTSLAYK